MKACINGLKSQISPKIFHIEILKNPRAFSAQQDHAGISDIILESAVSTICDNEDSVAAVDAEDKVLCENNILLKF